MSILVTLPRVKREKRRSKFLDDPEVLLMLRVQEGDDDPGAAEAMLTDRGEAPSRRMERSELAGVVRAAVSALAGRQRAAVELHQFSDYTYAEVAAQLDMTPKAAKSLLYRARNELREAL